jgi:hypothetical protein
LRMKIRDSQKSGSVARVDCAEMVNCSALP